MRFHSSQPSMCQKYAWKSKQTKYTPMSWKGAVKLLEMSRRTDPFEQIQPNLGKTWSEKNEAIDDENVSQGDRNDAKIEGANLHTYDSPWVPTRSMTHALMCTVAIHRWGALEDPISADGDESLPYPEIWGGPLPAMDWIRRTLRCRDGH